MISNKCFYALKAVLELSVHYGQGPVTIGYIAGRQNIPVRFLEAILRQLKQGGYADSIRGKEGGYFLARDPREIKVADIIRLFEGPLVYINPQATHDNSGQASIPDVFQDVWSEAEKALSDVYSEYDFRSLAEKEVHRTDSEAGNYTI